jgi:hypothetical protein
MSPFENKCLKSCPKNVFLEGSRNATNYYKDDTTNECVEECGVVTKSCSLCFEGCSRCFGLLEN